eukprot:9386533-Pyramimonas_sp.AAC.1
MEGYRNGFGTTLRRLQRQLAEWRLYISRLQWACTKLQIYATMLPTVSDDAQVVNHNKEQKGRHLNHDLCARQDICQKGRRKILNATS